ncbi:CYTH and CHAD domain-containing protein [Varunaivibrio sulfuroxidans]|uniref:Inorganic triphosphatase YgiF n=1 Tax=Varunaivibrio sulfuroxidans TaxID=1773489 RepID=A0A4R3J7A0_9PROT|nr:CYTH and CHAD domain-containing protein [Varunaivibrio sulfuroxidans]TCS61297.1 inorganic triphosphatase YgiF [Varunaivibrio sulfuroxidans]WES31087.1 CYTH and CHAD domain-containing protein [Varunaivibrio sulfuroxidans]
MSVHAPGESHPDERPGIELELKFDLSPGDVRKLCRMPWLKALQEGKVHRQSLHALYFDTPAHDLADRRISLRVRKESRAYVQCLKSNTASDCNGFSRQEKEWPVKRARLDPDLLKKDTRAGRALADIDIDTLTAVFETDITRQSRVLVCADGTRMKCEVDRGRIVAGDADVTIHEMELEFVSGEITTFYDIARKIAQSVPVRLSLCSKACRGFSLASGTMPHWQRARHPKPRRGASNGEVLRSALQLGLRQVLANAPCVLARSHEEGVHQMRVALRRMRSALSLYRGGVGIQKTRDLVGMIRETSAALGDARDWDVFIGTTLPAVRYSEAAAPGSEALLRRSSALRDEAYERAQAYLGSREYGCLLVELAACSTVHRDGEKEIGPDGAALGGDVDLGAPATDFAYRVLARGHARLMKRGRGLKKLSAADRHRLRIAVKKARYTSELFASLFDADKTHPYLKALGRLQDVLGHLNDRVVAERLLERVGAATPAIRDKSFRRAVGEVSGWYGHLQVSQEQELLSAWKSFRRRAPFWSA